MLLDVAGGVGFWELCVRNDVSGLWGCCERSLAFDLCLVLQWFAFPLLSYFILGIGNLGVENPR